MMEMTSTMRGHFPAGRRRPSRMHITRNVEFDQVSVYFRAPDYTERGNKSEELSSGSQAKRCSLQD